MKKFINPLLYQFFIWFLLFSPVTFATVNANFNRIVFFGDSLSDNGNLYRADFHLMPKSPPYFEGRFSNGSVWTEYVAQYFASVGNITAANFAMGGETVLNGSSPYTLQSSVNKFLKKSKSKDLSRTLFVIWMGGNDYVNGARAEELDELTTKVTDSIQATIIGLIRKSAQYFLIINSPDFSQTPYAKVRGHLDTFKAFSVTHNAKLKKVVANIQQNFREINIQLFDAFQLNADVGSNVDKYNKKYNLKLSNEIRACWQGGYLFRQMANSTQSLNQNLTKQMTQKNQSVVNFDQDKLLKNIVNSPDLREAYVVNSMAETGLQPCPNPEEYLFWDELHPTAVVHKLFAQIMIDHININFRRDYL